MLHLTVNQSNGVPIYLQLVQQIKALIATRRLRPHSELPPVRVLAQQLVLNPNTVVRAYRELETAGLVYKKRGAGTFVSSDVTPYTDAECRRILSAHADALVVEGINLGYDIEKLTALLQERYKTLEAQPRKEGAE